MKIDPITLKKLKRFRSIKRGYYSFILITFLIICSFFAELLVNNRAIMVSYQGELYFPTYGEVLSGRQFGLDYDYECNYRELKTKFENKKSDNWVLMPLVPYNPEESDHIVGEPAPHQPSFARQHYLGTDKSARDVLARLVYGFRIAIFFAIFLTIITYIVGIIIGCIMGYAGGWFDLIFQRLIEIWSNIPFLYVVMIVASIIRPNFWTLALIMVFFNWTGITWYLRTSTYKEKGREYVLAAQALGASHWRVIYHHIIPNSISVIITFIPFSISSSIVALTSLDYLGYGLPPPTPSWGELLEQGYNYLNHQWLLGSVIVAMVLVLTLVTFVGEAVREAFDPKKHAVYE